MFHSGMENVRRGWGCGWGEGGKFFLPTCPPRGAWVNRWTFSPSPSPPSPSPSSPHHQICQRPLTKTWFLLLILLHLFSISFSSTNFPGWIIGLSHKCDLVHKTLCDPEDSIHTPFSRDAGHLTDTASREELK